MINNEESILITGCAGLLGANLARYLHLLGYNNLVGIDNLSGGYKENFGSSIKHFYEIDLIETNKTEKIISYHKPKYVYHFACFAAEGLSPFIRNFNYTNNVIAYTNLVNSCIKHDVKKFLFTSSMAVYGAAKPPFTENIKPCPVDPYGIAKYAVEMDLKCAYEQFGLDYTIIRPHNIIGIYQNIWDKYRNVIGIWIRKCLAGEPITIFGDGSQRRAFSDIKYYMAPLVKLATTGSCETINIGADKHYSILEAAQIVQKIAESQGYNTKITFLEKRHEVHTAFCDHTKAKELLGFRDETDFEDMVYNMFIWAQSQPVREVKDHNYELEKGLYSYWRK